jgi:5-methylcytosine-specific restriction endonuclease McrA
MTISRETHDKLRAVQDLLAHADVASVFDRALDALKEKIEKRKFGVTDREKETTSRRYIPTWMKRKVWNRDGGRCTYVSADGHRCEATKHLEFDHVVPVAKGGKTTVENLRLRCRGHNQLEADRAFGKRFMDSKRS